MELSDTIDEGSKRGEFVGIPLVITRALDDRDAQCFYKMCLVIGYVPQGRTEQELFEQGRFELDDGMIMAIRPERQGRQVSRANYGSFISYVKKVGISHSQLEDIGLKREALKRAGYSHLWAGKGRKISIDKAGDGRIQMTFDRVYAQATK